MDQKRMIVPSVLAANYLHIESDIRDVTNAGASILHLDIMDGNFVPNISFGPAMVKSIASFSDLILDTHLMVKDPDLFLDQFKQSGSDILTVHVEACQHLHRTIGRIKDLGMKAGVSLNPATSLSTIEEILPYVDLVLIMSVNPGFGGQKFIETSVQKIRSLDRMIQDRKLSTIIEVDGGLDDTTIGKVINAGAHYCVAGNAIFGKGDITTNFNTLKKQLL